MIGSRKPARINRIAWQRPVLIVIGLLLVLQPVLASEPVRIGVLSFRPADQTILQWSPLQQALSDAIDDREFLIEALDYPALEAAVASRRLDFVLTNSGHYILLLRRYGLSAPLVTRIASHDGQLVKVFGGAIVARADNERVRSLADLAHARIAVVDRDSMGGFQMHAYELMAAGLPPLSERQLIATGVPHDRVIDAVLAGEADVGFVRAGLLESLVREGRLDPQLLRVVNRQDLPGLPFAVSTRLYPEWPLAAMPHSDVDLSRRVAATLLRLKDDPELAAALGIGGFTVPADYTMVEDMLRELRVAPFDLAPDVSLEDVWGQYRVEVLALASLVVVILLLLLLLAFNIRRLRAALVRVNDLSDIVGRSPVVAMAWRNQPGWPLQFVSDNVERFGYRVEDFSTGKIRFAELIHPEDLPRIEGEVAGYIVNGPDQYEQEYRIRHGEGHWIWVFDFTWLTRNSAAQVESIHGVLMDVSSRKQAEQEAAHGRDLLRYIIEHNRAAVAVHDRDLRYVYVSQKYIEVFEIEDPDIIGKHHYEVFPDLPQKWRDVHQRVLRGEVLSAEDDPFQRADGRLDWTSWSCRPWFEAGGGIGGLIVYTELITERKQAELDLQEKTRALAESNSRLAQLAAVFTHAREGIIISDADGDIIEVNEAFSRVTGYARDEVLGRNPRFLGSGRHSTSFFAAMWQQLNERGYWSGEIWNKRKNGEIYPQQATISAVRDEQGRNVQYVALLTDVTTEKHHARQLEYVTRYDTLTGLPNRALLTERLKRAMVECSRHDRTLAVVLLDLDDFRRVNEEYGSAVGDRVLCEFAQRLRASLAAGDTAARLGGDELVVLLTDLASEKQAGEALEGLLKLARLAFNVADVPVQLSASLGVSFFPQSAEVDADQLLRQADQAMYQAKLAGKDRIHYFNAEKDQAERGLHETLKRIEAGLKADEFALYYQPKVNMRTGEILGAEALLRWRHPERGTLPPAQFLPLVEGQPLALTLGDWVLSKALEQLAAWNRQGLRVAVSVNVFARQMLQPGFIEHLKLALEACQDVAPEQLEIEVLETSALEDIARISELIEQCQALGVRCALDDFGTGYSSLTYLRRLPASILKIDQSFVRDMLDDPEDLAILNGILGLSRAFQREVVAEGVETVAHGEILLDLGCELGQGYGIARPMPADAFPDWVAAWKPSRSWHNRSEKKPEQIKAIFAIVEHRAWVSSLVAYVQGNVERPPETSALHCAFGEWLHRSAAELFTDSDQLAFLHQTHERIHALAERVVTLKKAQQQSEAEAELKDVFAGRDQLLAMLADAVAKQSPAPELDANQIASTGRKPE